MDASRGTQRRTEMSTRLLLEAAAELIAEVGYERATLVAIGQRAGYSHGLVTQRFGSKDGLLHALVRRMTTDWAAEQLSPKVGTGSGLDGVAIVLEQIRDSADHNPAMVRSLYTLMFEAVRIPSLHDDMVEIHDSLRQKLTDTITRARDRAEIRADVDPAAAARLIVSALRGAAYQWLLDPQFPFLRTIDDVISWMRRDLSNVPTTTLEH